MDKDSVLLGPIFPVPANPGSSYVVQSARKSFPKVLQNALSTGVLDNSTTSFSINVFSASDNQTLFEYHFAAPSLNGSLPSGSLNNNTIYRIGSLSKLLTVYTLLAKNGFADFNQPVTDYIPELAAATTKSSVSDVKWHEITVEALASQMAGIARDYYINGLLSQSPVTSSFSTPIYSNAGFALLGLVIERVTNQTFEAAFESAILQPLNLHRTSVLPPTNDSNIIVPGGIVSSGFVIEIGTDNPAGSFFSTPSDLITVGLSILHSSILPKWLTRAWMKPHTTTSSPLHLVGAPWETFCMNLPLSPSTDTTRLVDLYTKSGDIGAYSSLLALDTDHNIGFSILAAGPAPGTQRFALASLIADTWVPALEAVAREEAKATYNGTYTNAATNTTITITVDDDRPGLNAATFIANGVDFRNSIRALNGVADPEVDVSIRLYPMDLVDGDLVSFRAIYEILPYSKAATEGVFSTNTDAWATVDGTVYATVGIDDFVFKLEGEEAVEVWPRVLRDVLRRV